MYNIFVLASMTCKWIWRQEMLSKLEKKTPKKTLTWILVVNSTTQSCSPSTGNNITEIGASYIHGPSEENPLFCLARDYGLLDPEALKPENQAMYIDERPHWSPNWFSCSGQWRFYHSLFFPPISSYPIDYFVEVQREMNILYSVGDVQVRGWVLSSWDLLWICLTSSWMKLNNFTIEEKHPGPA